MHLWSYCPLPLIYADTCQQWYIFTSILHLSPILTVIGQMCLQTKFPKYKSLRTVKVWKDGGKIGGNRVHFPLHMVETPSRSTEEQSQQHPSVYEHRRPKSIEDCEKTDGKGTVSGQKRPWDQRGDQRDCSPSLAPTGPASGYLGESPVNCSLPCQTRLEQHLERPGCLRSHRGE